MTGLNAAAKGLEDSRSGLFWEILRIKRLAEECWPQAQVEILIENTESAFLDEVTSALGIWPIRIEAAEICDARRPRHYWCSFDLFQCNDITELKPTARGWHLHLRPQGHGPTRWLDAGSSFTGKLLPTFVQVEPRKHPRLLPAGLKNCRRHEVARWRAAEYCSPPYQFRDECTILRPGGERALASAREREILMGFPAGHTASAVPSAEAKTKKTEQLRQSLLGNSFQCEVVAFLTGHLLVRWKVLALPPSVAAIRERHSPQPDDEPMPKLRGDLPAETALVLEHQRGLDPRGSDVRLDAGTLMAPKVFPRKAIASSLWQWTSVFRTLWRHADHINVLEATVILQSLKWRARAAFRLGTRFLHLSDSFVSIAVLSKYRSSSSKLNRVCQPAAAICLAASLYPMFGFCRSDDNPADFGSRAW